MIETDHPERSLIEADGETPLADRVLREVDAWLKRHAVGESTLSKAAMGDYGFISRFRKTRNPKMRSVERLLEYMRQRDQALADDKGEAA